MKAYKAWPGNIKVTPLSSGMIVLELNYETHHLPRQSVIELRAELKQALLMKLEDAREEEER